MTALDTPAGLNSRADEITNGASPLIVGALMDSGGVLTPTTWRNGTRVDLPKVTFARGHATAVNDQEQVVGYLQNTVGAYNAVMWMAGSPTMLGFLPGGSTSYARDINSFGQVVGFGSAPGTTKQAFLWTPTSANQTSGSMISLGTFGGAISEAWDANSRGVVVGTAHNAAGNPRGFVWSPTSSNGTTGTMTDLNTLLTTNSAGWVIEFATSINDGDVIVGWGRSPSGQAHRAILLQPQ
jgi:probable HAF family extracellular repeat protein